MTEIRTAHTADAAPTTLAAARALLVAAFDGEFDETDWEHSLGGMHVLAWRDGALAGHGAVVQRRLLHGGRALRAGYVEGVAVAADQRRRGTGRAVMAELARIIHGGYELGALASTTQALPFYRALGWQRWRGPTFALTPAGRVRTRDDDGAVYVLPGHDAGAGGLDLAGELTCDWRDGDLW